MNISSSYQHQLLFVILCCTIITLASFVFAAAGSTNNLRFNHRYQPFCNYVCNNKTNCPDPTKFNFMKCDQTQTGGGCTLPGCSRWSQGAFPELIEVGSSSLSKFQKIRINQQIAAGKTKYWINNATGKKYRVLNGGVPTYANVTLHLQKLEETISDHIPDRNYDGNFALDFEAWTPIWNQNDGSGNWHGKVYQDYAYEMMQNANPQWSKVKALEEAASAFESSGEAFFGKTLDTLQGLRPNSRIGYYGFPQGHRGFCQQMSPANKSDQRCGYDNPGITGKYFREQNDKVSWIWRSSSALFPSVYLPGQDILESFDTWRFLNQKYVNDTTYESIRLVNKFGNKSTPTPVIPFYWAYYHNASTLLLREDVKMISENTYVPPLSTAVIQWGSSSESNDVGPWQSSIGGPVMEMASDTADRCAKSLCSGSGWCNRQTLFSSASSTSSSNEQLLSSLSSSSTNSMKCVCDSGFSGNSCEKQN